MTIGSVAMISASGQPEKTAFGGSVTEKKTMSVTNCYVTKVYLPFYMYNEFEELISAVSFRIT